MIANYYNVSFVNFILNIKDALVGRYGAGVTIHYLDSLNVVFSCPSITSKVIKIQIASASYIDPNIMIGDAWVSGTTITNSFSCGPNSDYLNGVWADMILADNFIVFSTRTGFPVTKLFLLGTLTNGNSIAIGYGNSSTYIGKETLTNSAISLVGINNIFYSDLGEIFKSPVLIKKASGGLEYNSDGSPATILGFYGCSHTNVGTTNLVINNVFYSTTDIKTSLNMLGTQSSFMVELNTEY